MYEQFEHTADVGIRVRAQDLNSLFAEAGRALFSLMVPNFEEVPPTQDVEFQIGDQEKDLLLRDWLSELLLVFELGRLVLSEFSVRVDDRGLTAKAQGVPLDPARHRLEHEVKAITYHGLKVERTGGEWMAEVILDV